MAKPKREKFVMVGTRAPESKRRELLKKAKKLKKTPSQLLREGIEMVTENPRVGKRQKYDELRKKRFVRDQKKKMATGKRQVHWNAVIDAEEAVFDWIVNDMEYHEIIGLLELFKADLLRKQRARARQFDME